MCYFPCSLGRYGTQLLCQPDRTSINPRKIQLGISLNEKNRIFEVKSVVVFYRDSLLTWNHYFETLAKGRTDAKQENGDSTY